MNCQSFASNGYTTVVSLNDRAIYICVSNIHTFKCFEGTFERVDFKLPFTLPEIYKLVCVCLDPQASGNESVQMQSESNKMCVVFHTVVGGFLSVKFDVWLYEKIYGDDEKATLKINAMEQYQLKLLDRIDGLAEECKNIRHQNKQMMNILGNAVISIVEHAVYDSNNNNKQSDSMLGGISTPFIYICKMNSTELVLMGSATVGYRGSFQYCMRPDYTKICEFYLLEKLTLDGITKLNLADISSETITELHIINSPSVLNLQGIEQIPNVAVIVLKNLANLENVVTVLSAISHKIKWIVVESCPKVQTIELQTYCQANGIDLTEQYSSEKTKHYKRERGK